MTVLQFIGGLALLILGAEALIRGASQMALGLKISPLIVGLTVVAYGTGSPELFVSLQSVIAGKTQLALGNVVGSNICNVLLVLGVSALAKPLLVHRQIIRLEVPVMVGVSLLLLALSWDGTLDRRDGLVLVATLLGYTLLQIRLARRASKAEKSSSLGWKSFLFSAMQILLGLALLVLGSRFLVQAAIVFAIKLGFSELVIGLTVVAIGTSLPEIVTSILSARKDKADLAVGNVVGSNIFNILGILGVTALLASRGVPVPPEAFGFDLPVMVAAAISCLPIFFIGNRINRWEGLLFLAYFVAYTSYLILSSSHHRALPAYNQAMIFFAIPLTVVTLLILFIREVFSGIRRSEKIRTRPK